MPRYAALIYNGFWFSPEREMLQALIDKSQEFVAGTVRLKLYKGNTILVGRQSPYSLYSESLVTFEDDKGAYDQKDAARASSSSMRSGCAPWRCASAKPGNKHHEREPGPDRFLERSRPARNGPSTRPTWTAIWRTSRSR